MTSEGIIALVLGLLGAGGIGAMVAAIRKAGPERTNIIVSSAKILVELSREEVSRLDARLDEQQARIDELEAERHTLRRELEAERLANRGLETRNQELTERVRRLEEDLEQVRNGGAKQGGSS